MARRPRFLLALPLALLLGLAAASSARADDVSPKGPRASLEAELTRLEGVARVATSTDAAFRAACDGARIAFDLAEPEGGASGEIAERGMQLALRARHLLPAKAEGHYRFALCLGLYLRAHPISAGVTRTKELVAEGERAAELDGRFDHGGPHRFLAILYSEAPRFVGPGDHDKAREHLARLLEIDADDEDNKLTEARVWIALGEDDKARSALKRIRPEHASSEVDRASIRTERDRLQRKLDD